MKEKEEKKKKRFGIFYILLLCLVIIVVALFVRNTMSQYTSGGTGTATAEVAKWNVAFSGDNHTWSDTYEMTFLTNTNANVVAGKIAPGLTATGTGYIQLAGTETAVNLTIAVGDLPTALAGANFSVTGVTAQKTDATPVVMTDNHDGTYSASIPLPGGAAMTSADDMSFVVTISWDNDSDNGITDTGIGTSLTEIQIPVTVTAVQKQS